jgi:hypothetical protein
MSHDVTLGTIFQDAGEAYRSDHRVPGFQRKAMLAIERCRTSALGGHVDRCDHCGYERVQYNSCRNRHCPNCQGLARKSWVHAREQELLPIPYFHVVFTLPDELHPIALVNQREIYRLLFRAASETLLELAKDERHMGGHVGVIAVLHTWGQAITDHPHLHCIVTGGGISNDESRWVSPKKLTAKRDFFIHVNVISDFFKKKFLYYLKREYRAGAFKWVGNIRYLQDKRSFQQLIDELYEKSWVTYCKKPFGGPEQVIRYLGHYTHRVAISNKRILSYSDGLVTFRWKDYRDQSRTKIMPLAVDEFIRRFLLHILPDNFYRIRYYGFLANRNRKANLSRCRQLLGVSIAMKSPELSSKTFDILLLELCGIDAWRCPECETGTMHRVKTIERMTGIPP